MLYLRMPSFTHPQRSSLTCHRRRSQQSQQFSTLTIAAGGPNHPRATHTQTMPHAASDLTHVTQHRTAKVAGASKLVHRCSQDRFRASYATFPLQKGWANHCFLLPCCVFFKQARRRHSRLAGNQKASPSCWQGARLGCSVTQCGSLKNAPMRLKKCGNTAKRVLQRNCTETCDTSCHSLTLPNTVTRPSQWWGAATVDCGR